MRNIEEIMLQGDKEIEKMSTIFIKKLVKKYKQNNRYDYIVLTTRRCFCLYYCIQSSLIFKLKNLFWYIANFKYLKEIEKKVCSSQSVDIIGDKFRDSNVLLVDDIMIHGQTVYSYYKRILDYNAKNIDTLVAIRNIERPDYYYIQTKKEYTSIFNKVNWNWRDTSDKIVSYLHDMGHLYVSYVYGFDIDEKILYEVIEKRELHECKTEFSHFIKHPVYSEECQPQYYYVSEFCKYQFIKYAFLRVYPVKKHNKIKYKILPYIELANFNCDNIHYLWKKIWKNGMPCELDCIKKTEDIYKALTAILSYKFCEKFFGDNAILTTPEIDKSFVNNFLEIVENNLCEDPFDVINMLYLPVRNEDIFEHETLMRQEFNKIDSVKCDTIFSMLETIKQYLYSVGNKEELIFRKFVNNCQGDFSNIPSKQQPIPTSQFYELIPKEFNNECLGFLIYLLDNGVASHVVRMSDSKQYVMTSLKAGELSYHLFSDLLGSALRVVYFLLTYLNSIKEQQEKVRYIKTEFINKIKELGIVNAESIEFVLNNPTVNLRADYFGIIKRRVSCLTAEEIQEEKNIKSILEKIIL